MESQISKEKGSSQVSQSASPLQEQAILSMLNEFITNQKKNLEIFESIKNQVVNVLTINRTNVKKLEKANEQIDHNYQEISTLKFKLQQLKGAKITTQSEVQDKSKEKEINKSEKGNSEQPQKKISKKKTFTQQVANKEAQGREMRSQTNSKRQFPFEQNMSKHSKKYKKDLPFQKPQKQLEIQVRQNAPRNKEQRKHIEGQACLECEQFYQAVFKSDEQMMKAVKSCSKHKSNFPIQEIPDNFYNFEILEN